MEHDGPTQLQSPKRLSKHASPILERRFVVSAGLCPFEPQLGYETVSIQEQSLPIYDVHNTKSITPRSIFEDCPVRKRFSRSGRTFKSYQVELFNPDYPKPTTRTLLEAVRDRMTSFISPLRLSSSQDSLPSSDTNDWSESSLSAHDLQRVKLPKETRNAKLPKNIRVTQKIPASKEKFILPPRPWLRFNKEKQGRESKTNNGTDQTSGKIIYPRPGKKSPRNGPKIDASTSECKAVSSENDDTTISSNPWTDSYEQCGEPRSLRTSGTPSTDTWTEEPWVLASDKDASRKYFLQEEPELTKRTKPVSKSKIKPDRSVPCPLNILCDRGIHVGLCDPKIREKVATANSIRRPHSSRTSDCHWSSCGRRNRSFFRADLIPTKLTSADKSPARLPAAEDDENVETLSSAVERVESTSPRFDNADNDSLSGQTSSASTSGVSSSSSSQQFRSAAANRNMNGMNGHANGELNGCGDIITQNQQKGCWTIGLINSKFRYLTAETFGFKINANGASLKKKQIWTLEPESPTAGDSLIYLRSHLDKYLAVDSFGNVTCESDEKDAQCQFQISVSEDGTGRWALKNVVRGYFLGSTQDKLTCTAKVPGDSELWHIHLAARPQVNLRSVGRKRFAHLSENLDEIHVDANIPWGEDTLFTLEFRLEESGKYAIHTCNNKYLSMSGKLVDVCNKDCFFSAEYHSGQLALRDRTGQYLSPIGSKAVLKTRSNTVTKDELFSLEDSLPQASFVASLNSRFVSVKQGVDVTANQDEISDHETFQLEFDWSTKRWYIRTMQDRYWTLETGGGIQASGDKRSSNALFDLVWQADGSLAFRANNGRYVITKRSGHLYATSDAIDDTCKYYFYLINRPILVLKCEQGFVGYKAASNPKLECNKATYECIQVERGEKGVVFFKGQNGKYWHVDSEGVTADSDAQEGFHLELREPTRLCIKSAANGNYLTASKNGLFRLGDSSIENATQWEY